MKKSLVGRITAVVLAAALLIPAPAHAQAVTQSTKVVAVTSTNSVVTLGLQALEVSVANDGPNNIYVSMAGTASSSDTASVALLSCETGTWYVSPGAPIASLNIASANGESATARVAAFTTSNMSLQSIDLPTARQPYFVKTSHCQTPGAGTLSQTTVNGASWSHVVNSESITLSTGGSTTDSSGNLLPANSIIDSVVCRVTTTITTATTWAAGDGTTAQRFIANDSTMTSGETQVGLAAMFGAVSTTAAGPTQASAAKLRITTTGTPGAGVVRCTVFARTFVGPTS